MVTKAKFKAFLLISFFLVSTISANAQETSNGAGFTAGTLTFTVKTITNNSTYSPKNVFAIWIKDAQGNLWFHEKLWQMHGNSTW